MVFRDLVFTFCFLFFRFGMVFDWVALVWAFGLKTMFQVFCVFFNLVRSSVTWLSHVFVPFILLSKW